MPVQPGKKDNFFGDRSIVFSGNQLKSIKENPLSEGLYISDIGFYPNAKNHYRRRIKGINEHILIYCINGCGTIQLGDNIYQLEQHSYFVIKAHTSHTYWASERDPWSIYWLHFGGKRSLCFEEFFCRVIKTGNPVNSRTDDRIKLFNELLTALELGFSRENINYSNLCLSSLLASFFYMETYMGVKGYKSTNPVDQSIAFMQENISRNLTISDIAESVRLSESHFSRIFRNRTGTSPLEYFIQMRMQEAVRLITSKPLKIKEVAYMLGYTDPYYFTRIFTKYTGCSPATFVKMSRRTL